MCEKKCTMNVCGHCTTVSVKKILFVAGACVFIYESLSFVNAVVLEIFRSSLLSRFCKLTKFMKISSTRKDVCAALRAQL